MSAANPNPMEKSMVLCWLLQMQGGGSLLPCGIFSERVGAGHVGCSAVGSALAFRGFA
jgi:hypothetical protein